MPADDLVCLKLAVVSRRHSIHDETRRDRA
jgi:hypothetical protein